MSSQPDFTDLAKLFGKSEVDKEHTVESAAQALSEPEVLTVIITTSHTPIFRQLQVLAETYNKNPQVFLAYIVQGIDHILAHPEPPRD